MNFIFIFMNMKHPSTVGLTMLFQTTLICLLLRLMAKTFGFSYILFLGFLGVMLVLFIYVTSLAPNAMFSFSTKLIITALVIFYIINCFILY